jgi:MoaA/NifB/PqqE/SkfB family radical SAM enzyme
MNVGLYRGIQRDVNFFSKLHAGLTFLSDKREFTEGRMAVGFIEVSPYCARRCVGCYADQRTSGEIVSLDLVGRFIDELKPYGPTTFSIVGGEPYEPGIEDTTLKIVKNFPWKYFGVCTNGFHIDTKLADQIAALPNQTIVLSYDGLEDLNDRRRGRGAFGAQKKAAGLLKERGVFLTGYVTLTSDNFEEVSSEKFLHFLAASGIKVVSFQRFFPAGHMLAPSDDEYVSALRNLHKFAGQLPMHLAIPRFGFMGNPNLSEPRNALTLCANGDIKYGRASVAVHGNLNESHLDDILLGSSFQRFMAEQNDLNNHRDGDLQRILERVLE